jgi:hypothetical protein
VSLMKNQHIVLHEKMQNREFCDQTIRTVDGIRQGADELRNIARDDVVLAGSKSALRSVSVERSGHMESRTSSQKLRARV